MLYYSIFFHLLLSMDCFAFVRNDDNNNGLLRSARNDDNDGIASLSLAMTTTTMDCFTFVRNDDNNNGLLHFRSQWRQRQKKGCLLFDRFPLNCFAGMTKKIKTLGNKKKATTGLLHFRLKWRQRQWIASLSFAMTTTTKKHKLSQMTKNKNFS